MRGRATTNRLSAFGLLKSVLLHGMLLLYAAIVISPMIWLASSSLKTSI